MADRQRGGSEFSELGFFSDTHSDTLSSSPPGAKERETLLDPILGLQAQRPLLSLEVADSDDL